jgi:hypothetical protein
MLRRLKRSLDHGSRSAKAAVPGYERRHLQVAVASLLHEAIRVDFAGRPEERAAAGRALAELFGLRPWRATACARAPSGVTSKPRRDGRPGRLTQSGPPRLQRALVTASARHRGGPRR